MRYRRYVIFSLIVVCRLTGVAVRYACRSASRNASLSFRTTTLNRSHQDLGHRSLLQVRQFHKGECVHVTCSVEAVTYEGAGRSKHPRLPERSLLRSAWTTRKLQTHFAEQRNPLQHVSEAS